MTSDITPRWLNSKQAASYTGFSRTRQFLLAVKTGKLPQPTYPLGPRSPRWDRVALDAIFVVDRAPPVVDIERMEQEAVNGILERARCAQEARGRNR